MRPRDGRQGCDGNAGRASARATRKHKSSRHGAAIICTPIGTARLAESAREHRQADARDRLRQQARGSRAAAVLSGVRSIRCRWRARDTAWPRAISTSTVAQQRADAHRDTTRGRAAPSRTTTPGSSAPARKRSRDRARSLVARAQVCEVQRAALACGDDERGRTAGDATSGIRPRRVPPSAAHARSTARARRRRMRIEVAAEACDAQARRRPAARIARPAPPGAARTPDRLGPRPAARRSSGEIGERRGERAEMVEAATKGYEPVRGSRPNVGFSPRCRTATPARGWSRWCRSRARAAPGGDRGRPSRPTSRPRRAWVVRIAGRAVVRVLGGEAVGVLVHVERADEHRARGAHARDEDGIARRGGAARSARTRPASSCPRRRTDPSPRTARRRAAGAISLTRSAAHRIRARFRRARSRVTAVKLLSAGSTRAMVPSVDSAIAEAVVPPAFTASAMSSAVDVTARRRARSRRRRRAAARRAARRALRAFEVRDDARALVVAERDALRGGGRIDVSGNFRFRHRRTSRWKISRLRFLAAMKLGSESVATVRGRASS